MSFDTTVYQQAHSYLFILLWFSYHDISRQLSDDASIPPEGLSHWIGGDHETSHSDCDLFFLQTNTLI